ncbi:MAG TPA: hypothetical protein VMZ53_23285, partial [Kofleriaceae bacterium]|nr:hypothetical protein [Kofleriaceae bacterium]
MLGNERVIDTSHKPSTAQIDRALRDLAQQHAALEADEAHWLRLADQQKIWPKLGYVHALEYLEDVFGYAPRTAKDRIRVARELGDLPQLEDELRCGELSYSVVRELTRVATPETVERWIEQARGRRLRDVEQMVSGRKKGDDPDDKPDANLVKHTVVLELDGASMAIWREMQAVLEAELETSLDDRALVLALGDRILGAASTAVRDRAPSNDNEIDGPDAPDAPAAAGAADAAYAPDAVADTSERLRATKTIPAATKRRVLERDQGRCQVPGCRSRKHLQFHHIEFQSHGGGHEDSNLLLLCGGHHRLLHDGLLTIAGRAPNALVFTRNGQRLRSADDGAQPQLSGRDTHATSKHAPVP